MSEKEEKKEERAVRRSEKLLAQIDKAKKTDTKKTVKALTLFFGLVMIVVMTITNFVIDPKFDFVKWLSNAMILAGIMVFGLFMGESMGADRQMERPQGLYQTALLNYKDYSNSITDKLPYFSQWFRWFMPQELENKKETILIEHGVNNINAKKIVKYCVLRDADLLVQHPIKKKLENGKEIIITQIEDYQLDIVKHVLSGEVKLESCSCSYYLTATGKSTNKSVLERGNQLDKEIKFNKTANRIKKIVFTLGISLILGLFTAEQLMDGNGVQAWMNLVTRITALLTAFISGWSSAITDIRLKAEKIENKIVVLRLFNYSLINKEFKPLNEEELAEEEYKKWEKEEQEAKDSVIVPDEILELDNKSMQIK